MGLVVREGQWLGGHWWVDYYWVDLDGFDHCSTS